MGVETDVRPLSGLTVLDLSRVLAGPYCTVKLVASAMKLSRTPCKTLLHPPLLGEHTDEILQDQLGFSLEQIQQLREKGAV